LKLTDLNFRVTLSGDDFQRLHQIVSKLPGASKKRKIAVVVSRKFGYGLARQSRIYAELSEIQAEYHIASTLDEAMMWLEGVGGS
jgi:hypothetical protein